VGGGWGGRGGGALAEGWWGGGVVVISVGVGVGCERCGGLDGVEGIVGHAGIAGIVIERSSVVDPVRRAMIGVRVLPGKPTDDIVMNAVALRCSRRIGRLGRVCSSMAVAIGEAWSPCPCIIVNAFARSMLSVFSAAVVRVVECGTIGRRGSMEFLETEDHCDIVSRICW
jgi:hypothetical protein